MSQERSELPSAASSSSSPSSSPSPSPSPPPPPPPGSPQDASCSDSNDGNGQFSTESLSSILNNAINTQQLSSDEAAKIIALHQALVEAKSNAADKELQLLQREESFHESLQRDKLSVMQKENDEESLAKIEIEREQVQRQLDPIKMEYNETAFKLQKVEEAEKALRSRLDDVKAENADLVEPEFKRLKREATSLQNEREEVWSEHGKESSRLQKLESLKMAHIAKRVEAETETKEKRVMIANSTDEPKMIAKEMVYLEKQIRLHAKDVERLEQRINEVQLSSIDQTKSQRKEIDYAKKSLDKDIQGLDNESKQHDVSSIEKKVDELKSQHQALATDRSEIEIALKESNERLRHSKATAVLEKRQLDAAQRMHTKQVQATDKAKEILPQLQTKLEENRATVLTYEKKSLEQRATIDDMKKQAQLKRMRLLRQENVGKQMENQLVSVVDAIEGKEKQVAGERTEEKKLCTIISSMEAQRDLLRRKAEQVLEKAEEVEDKIKIKKLAEQDLQKICNGTRKQIKEVAALQESIENERCSGTDAIDASEKALAELKIKVDRLEPELDKLKGKSREKAYRLSKERDAHRSSLATRDVLRAERDRIRGTLRGKRDHLERENVQLQFLKSTVGGLGKSKRLLEQNIIQTATAKRLITEQLDDRKRELSRYYERASSYDETLRKGEVSVRMREEHIRKLTLERSDLRRNIKVTKHNMPDIDMLKERIMRYESEIADERKRVDEVSGEMEYSSNKERARLLGGDDLHEEQLTARLEMLETRLLKNRLALMGKENALANISNQTKSLEGIQTQKRIETRPLIQELNLCRGRAKDMAKNITALTSELRMYQSKVLTLMEQKEAQEKKILGSNLALEDGKATSDETGNELRTKSRGQKQDPTGKSVAVRG